ncbi:MAG: Crp/Fnr family transcriptional regulator [Alphaproteobacteria bacterium]|nr:Crp/Fnr family transcriptional regulator [Alphaproteobacteria bacterium]
MTDAPRPPAASPSVDPAGRPFACRAGEVLFRPGDPCRGFVVVRRGTIRVSLSAANGREIVLYRVRPGEVCLQTFNCLIEGHPYAAEGVAETALEAEMVPAAVFREKVSGDAAFRDLVFAAVARRFADFERLVEEVALTGLEARLARALLRLAAADGTLESTHDALAAEIGSARAVVSRQLAAFARRGLIARTRGRIRILAAPALRALAGETA